MNRRSSKIASASLIAVSTVASVIGLFVDAPQLVASGIPEWLRNPDLLWSLATVFLALGGAYWILNRPNPGTHEFKNALPAVARPEPVIDGGYIGGQIVAGGWFQSPEMNLDQLPNTKDSFVSVFRFMNGEFSLHVTEENAEGFYFLKEPNVLIIVFKNPVKRATEFSLNIVGAPGATWQQESRSYHSVAFHLSGLSPNCEISVIGRCKA